MKRRERPLPRLAGVAAAGLLVFGGLVVSARIGLLGLLGGTEAGGRVVDVVDGDTIKVEVGGRRYTVRYIGIDTPETVDPRRPVQPMGREAAARNRALVEGRSVRLEKDVSETDRFGRLLRYVWVDGRLVNAQLIEEGLARAVSYPPDVRYQDLFRELEREARESRRGLWGLPP